MVQGRVLNDDGFLFVFEKRFYRGMCPGRNELLILNCLIQQLFEIAHGFLRLECVVSDVACT